MNLSAHEVGLLVAALLLVARKEARPTKIPYHEWLRVYTSTVNLIPRA